MSSAAVFEFKSVKLPPEVAEARRTELEAKQGQSLAETTREIRQERMKRQYRFKRTR